MSIITRDHLFDELTLANKRLYSKFNLSLANFSRQTEGKEYHAATFNLNDRRIIYRSSKITPTKVGQFVTCWKRNLAGFTTPFQQEDPFNFLIISCGNDSVFGQFIFPKSCLIRQGIVSTPKSEGKRGFRLYPAWDYPTNKQAIKTQRWQMPYFVQIHPKIEIVQFSNLIEHKINRDANLLGI